MVVARSRADPREKALRDGLPSLTVFLEWRPVVETVFDMMIALTDPAAATLAVYFPQVASGREYAERSLAPTELGSRDSQEGSDE